MKHEDIYSAVQAYLDNKSKKTKFINNKDMEVGKQHIQDLVGKKISLNNIKMVGEK